VGLLETADNTLREGRGPYKSVGKITSLQTSPLLSLRTLRCNQRKVIGGNGRKPHADNRQVEKVFSGAINTHSIMYRVLCSRIAA